MISKTNKNILKTLDTGDEIDPTGFESRGRCRGRLLRKLKDGDGDVEPLICGRRVLDGGDPRCSWFDELVVDHAALVPNAAFFGCFDLNWGGRRWFFWFGWVVSSSTSLLTGRRGTS